MRCLRHLWLTILVAGSALIPYAAGCSSSDETPGGTTPPPGEEDEGELPGPNRGSAVALSPDDRAAVAVNRDVGTLSVFELGYAREGYSRDGSDSYLPDVAKKKEINLGAGSEPWQVVISPNGNKAYVVLRHAQEVVKINGLRSDNPYIDGRVHVGSEPTGLALSPSGKRLFVANWSDGTVMELQTRDLHINRTIDLNAALVGTGYLGKIEPRPALAHPRSIAVTSNLNRSDDDESVLITEYFGQRFQPIAADGSNADTSVRGVVYKLSLGDYSVQVIPLAPLADIGFKDLNNDTAGCYPNQLQSVTIAGAYAYVTSVCASPRGPIGVFAGPAAKVCATDLECPGAAAGSCNLTNKRCKTNCVQDLECGANAGKCGSPATPNVCVANITPVKTWNAPVVHVIDVANGVELTGSSATLNAQFNNLFNAKKVADDASRRLPQIANDVAFVPKPIFKDGHGQPIDETPGGSAWITANAADAVFRVQYDFNAGSRIREVGTDANNFTNLNPAGIPADASGKNPIGIAIGYTGKYFALVNNDVSRNLTVLDLRTKEIAKQGDAFHVIRSADLPAQGSNAFRQLQGKRFFFTGTGRWSLKGQAWGACQTCHTDGLSDNVSWHFPRGPRQSVSLDSSFSSKDPLAQRIFNWTAIFDEVDDFELNTRGVSGGVGAIVKAVTQPFPVNTDRIDIVAEGNGNLNGSSELAGNPANPAGFAAPGLLPDWGEITDWLRIVRSPRAPTNLNPQYVSEGKALFLSANCQGCHGGDKWTISTLFYVPNKETTAKNAVTPWTPPSGFPQALLPASTPENRLLRFPSTNANLDQIQCILRPVGTFGNGDRQAGSSELRQDMKTVAQGNETDGKGYNPPSLLSVNNGAPYLHSGGALTLESLFSAQFKAHYAALSPTFLTGNDEEREEKVEALVHYLLSIDETTPAPGIPPPGALGGDFCKLP
jgi:DNA-binding beta-propeller fold protein YncE